MIELLVAMSVLVIIILIVSLVFQRASTVWDAGMNKAELDMTGRAVVDYVAQELSAAVRNTNAYSTFNASGHTADFWVMGDANGTNRAVSQVNYNFAAGALTRNGIILVEGLKELSFSNSTVAGELTGFVDVVVTVTNEMGVESLYQSRAYFMNQDRYKL